MKGEVQEEQLLAAGFVEIEPQPVSDKERDIAALFSTAIVGGVATQEADHA